MTTNKPEVRTWEEADPDLGGDVMVVRLSDYEALQAECRILESELATVKKVAYGNVDLLDECEKLRAAMIEAKSYIDHYMYGGSSYRGPAAKAIALIDAALAAHRKGGDI